MAPWTTGPSACPERIAESGTGRADPDLRAQNHPRTTAGPDLVPALDRFALIGFFGTRARPIAVLTDGDTTWNARIDDRLPDDRRIEAIGVDPQDDMPIVVIRQGPPTTGTAITLRVDGRS